METTLQAIYCTYLKEEGFPQTHIDEEGDLIFKAEGRVYFIRMNPEFPERFALVLPSFWALEDAEETRLALACCNEVNCKVHGITLFCVHHNVTAVAELFLADPEEDIKDVFYPAFKALQGAAYLFATLMYKNQPPGPPPGGGALIPAHTGNGADTAAGYL